MNNYDHPVDWEAERKRMQEMMILPSLERKMKEAEEEMRKAEREAERDRAICWGFFGFWIGAACGMTALPIVVYIVYKQLDSDTVGYLTLAGALVGGAIGAIFGAYLGIWNLREDTKEARRKYEAARLEWHKEQQKQYCKELLNLGELSLGQFESLPELLESAAKFLDRAERDFAEGAFSPFWDSIEHAAECLGHFDKCVRKIEANASRYTEIVKDYEGTPPPYPIARESVEKLRAGTIMAERMQAIVRKAQCNFQFAQIYEQRMTNKILIAGFKNLREALEGMTWQVTASIDNLSSSVGVMTSTLNESLRAIHSRLGDTAEMSRQQHEERAARERKVVEMLDNIQRGRRPVW
jgi:hypothetical protein